MAWLEKRWNLRSVLRRCSLLLEDTIMQRYLTEDTVRLMALMATASPNRRLNLIDILQSNIWQHHSRPKIQIDSNAKSKFAEADQRERALVYDIELLQIIITLQSMGTSASLDCCQNPNPNPNEFVSIVPTRMHAIAVVEENLTAIRQCICRTSFLSQLDYYLLRLKNSQQYTSTFGEEFAGSEELLDTITYEDNVSWDIPLQTKTYELKNSRFNPVDSINFPVEFGVISLENGYQEKDHAVLLRNNLRKIEWLCLEKSFGSYKEEEFVGLMVDSLRKWEGLKDYIWGLEAKSNYSEMSRHLHYRLGWFLPFINSQLSINDAVSWAQVRYLFQYLLNQIASEPAILEPVYFLDNWVHQAEATMLYPGQIITLHNFSCFAPYFQEPNYNEDDTVRFNPPRGDDQTPRVKLRIIVRPHKQTRVKFRNYQYLYYLPFSIFKIQNIQQKYGLIYIHLQQLESQSIIDYLRGRTRQTERSKLTKNDTKRMISEISAFRDSYSKKLQEQFDPQLNKIDPISLSYYQRYIKNRVNVLISEQELPVLSKRELQICEEDVKVKLDLQVTHQEAESEVREVFVSQHQREVLEKELHRYIKKNNFQKLQNQIDNADVFINITSLNISQCWLQKLECLHCFPNLTQLFAYSNAIKKIEGLHRNENLRLLSLARNQIEVLENIEHLVHLRELYLTKNKLELNSAVYLSKLNLGKLKFLTISFKAQVDQCFEALLHRPPPRLKKLLINEGDLLAQRTKNSLKRRLKGVEIQYIHG